MGTHSGEWMGCLALGILWVNALLVAAATARQVRAILARRRIFGVVVRGRVVRGAGPGEALAALRVDHDGAAQGVIFGGTLTLDRGAEMTLPEDHEGEVWLDDRALAEARGFDRAVTVPVAAGARVFVSAGRPGGILVASMDPRALLARKAALGAGFVAAELLAAAGCTALALWPPLLGLVSTAGGVLGLLLFLLVRPAGAAVRDALLLPSRAPVRGVWARPAA